MAYGETSNNLLAAVGEEAISAFDVKTRTTLLKACFFDQAHCVHDVSPNEVLQSLIDEKLFIQEAARLKVTLSQEEIDDYIRFSEERLSLRPGKFREYLKIHGLSELAMMEYIKANLLWNKIIEYKIAPTVKISANELQETIGNLNPDTAKITFEQIFISAEELNLEDKISELSKIRTKINSCQDLANVAKKMNRASDKITVAVNNLNGDLRNMVKVLPVGKASKPIKTASGVHLIVVCKRDYVGLSPQERQEVVSILMRKKVLLQAQYYLHNLRKKGLIERY
jgi:peptidyl-prolyl cis-trans isomerase SurA